MYTPTCVVYYKADSLRPCYEIVNCVRYKPTIAMASQHLQHLIRFLLDVHLSTSLCVHLPLLKCTSIIIPTFTEISAHSAFLAWFWCFCVWVYLPKIIFVIVGLHIMLNELCTLWVRLNMSAFVVVNRLEMMNTELHGEHCQRSNKL